MIRRCGHAPGDRLGRMPACRRHGRHGRDGRVWGQAAAAACAAPGAGTAAGRQARADRGQRADEGVTVINARGHMDQAAVEAGLAPHNEELSDCYMKNVKRRQWLGGHVVIHWDIKKDGTITAVKLMGESDLGAWPIEKCLLEVARSASFDKPIGGDADFSLPLEFSAKGHTLPWSEDQALRAVGGQLVKLEACDKKHARPHDVTITLYVGPTRQGPVRGVLVRCVRDQRPVGGVRHQGRDELAPAGSQGRRRQARRQEVVMRFEPSEAVAERVVWPEAADRDLVGAFPVAELVRG